MPASTEVRLQAIRPSQSSLGTWGCMGQILKEDSLDGTFFCAWMWYVSTLHGILLSRLVLFVLWMLYLIDYSVYKKFATLIHTTLQPTQMAHQIAYMRNESLDIYILSFTSRFLVDLLVNPISEIDNLCLFQNAPQTLHKCLMSRVTGYIIRPVLGIGKLHNKGVCDSSLYLMF